MASSSSSAAAALAILQLDDDDLLQKMDRTLLAFKFHPKQFNEGLKSKVCNAVHLYDMPRSNII